VHFGSGDDVIALRLANHRSVLARSPTFRRSPARCPLRCDSASLPWQKLPTQSVSTPTAIHSHPLPIHIFVRCAGAAVICREDKDPAAATKEKTERQSTWTLLRSGVLQVGPRPRWGPHPSPLPFCLSTPQMMRLCLRAQALHKCAHSCRRRLRDMST